MHAASLNDEKDTEGVRQEIENDPKLTAHPDEEAIDHVSIEEFMHTLSPEDRKMIALRLQGKAYEDIAKGLSVQDHSAVVKRMRRLGEKFEQSTGIDCGFSEKKKKSSYNNAR